MARLINWDAELAAFDAAQPERERRQRELEAYIARLWTSWTPQCERGTEGLTQVDQRDAPDGPRFSPQFEVSS